MGIFSHGIKRHGQDSTTSSSPRRDQADVLAMAVMMKLPEVVASGVKQGIDVNRVGQAGVPALNLAAATDQTEIAEILLDAGAHADVPAGDHAMTPLHNAVTNGNVRLVRRLIAAGADVNRVFGEQMTALAVAVRKGNLELMQGLLEAGASPEVGVEPPSAGEDQRGITPLILAASTGNLQLLDLFIVHKADVNRPKANGLTPLVCATMNGEFEVIRRLVAAGAAVRPVRDIDPVELARRTGRPEIADFLASARQA